jgi:hypothetical protein
MDISYLFPGVYVINALSFTIKKAAPKRTAFFIVS